jgi:hypothetical protein
MAPIGAQSLPFSARTDLFHPRSLEEPAAMSNDAPRREPAIMAADVPCFPAAMGHNEEGTFAQRSEPFSISRRSISTVLSLRVSGCE